MVVTAPRALDLVAAAVVPGTGLALDVSGGVVATGGLEGAERGLLGAGGGGAAIAGAGRAMTYSPTNQVTHTSDPGTGNGTGTTDYSYTSVDQTQRDRITTKAGGALTPSTTDLTQSAIGITGLTQNGTARTTVWRDPNGRMLGYKDPQGGVHYTATDSQNTTLGSSSSGALDAKYQYAPYGRVVGAQGSAAGSNSFTYAGDLRLGNDHQNLNGARTYDAINGRFTQPDPSSQGANPYTYGADNPTSYSDPSGLAPAPDCGDAVNAQGGVFAGGGFTVNVQILGSMVLPPGQFGLAFASIVDSGAGGSVGPFNVSGDTGGRFSVDVRGKSATIFVDVTNANNTQTICTKRLDVIGIE